MEDILTMENIQDDKEIQDGYVLYYFKPKDSKHEARYVDIGVLINSDLYEKYNGKSSVMIDGVECRLWVRKIKSSNKW